MVVVPGLVLLAFALRALEQDRRATDQTGNVTALFDLQNVADAALPPDFKTLYYSPRITPFPCVKMALSW